MKYLFVGLGNIGEEYKLTRHNIGFMVLDALARASNFVFTNDRYACVANYRFKGKQIICIKPTTYMNLSGKAVRYWQEKENIPLSQIMVIVDDIALPFGTIRIRPEGNNGGHNGLISIDEALNSNNYPRMRFGIGNNYAKGQQANYVLSPFTPEEQKILPYYIELMKDALLSFVVQGLDRTMNFYNKKWLPPENLSQPI